MKIILTFDLTGWGLCLVAFKPAHSNYKFAIGIQILCFDLLIYFKKKNGNTALRH